MADLRRLNNYDKNLKITTLYLRLLADKDVAQKLQHDDILNHFSAFGDVSSVRLRKKPKRSYGFVKFTQPESAAKALQTKIHTIAGGRVKINAAYNRHQDFVSLLDINNDCLLVIFSVKCLSIEDLCAVAETCRRLKEIAGIAFSRQYKNCDLNVIIPKIGVDRFQSRFDHGTLDDSVAKRILVNFGSVIAELNIDGRQFKGNKRTDVLESVTYCNQSLNSLTLHSIHIPENFAAKFQPIFKNLQKLRMEICTFEGASKELFADCPAMEELAVSYSYKEDVTFIIEKTFPKLQHFEYKPFQWSAKVHVNFEPFLSRHQNLRVLNISKCNERSSLLQSITDNCRQLEQLECKMPKDSTFDLSNFGRLTKLTLDFHGQNVTKSSLGWNNLNFLVEIKLHLVDIDAEFVRLLSQLKGLRILELEWCTGIQSLQQMNDMNELTEFTIMSSDQDNDFDLVRLIQRLGNLKYLTVEVIGWSRLEEETYLAIVEIVKRRRKSKLTLRLYTECNDMDVISEHEDVFHRNQHIVEMRLGCSCYS